MSRSTIVYTLFCLGVIAAFFWAARDGFSPFGSGSGSGSARSSVHAAAGPHHK